MWDTREDAQEFLDAARAAFRGRHGAPATQQGFSLFAAKPWTFAWGEHAGGVVLVSSDDPQILASALQRLRAILD